MKDLPRVSAFPINKEIKNSQDRFYSTSKVYEKKVNIVKKINDIFTSNSHVYKSNVKITTRNDIIEKTIIGKSGSELLCLNGEKIPIIEIFDIEKI